MILFNYSRKDVSVIILKERTSPILIDGLKAAIKRTPNHHPAFPKIQAQLVNVQAGFGGEQELDRVLRHYQFPEETYILNDLSLSSSSLFQIDTVILTPEFALICEVKNIAGELSVKDNPPQLIRVADDGKISGFLSPLAQVSNTCQLFEDWLLDRAIHLPVYGCVVLAYTKQRITLPPTEIATLFPRLVPKHVRSILTGNPIVNHDELTSLAERLLNAHKEFAPVPVCVQFNIKPSHIIGGVECPGCNRLGMWKRGKSWYCPSCKTLSHDAHRQAILDWFLLIGAPLTNKACRTFLGMKSPRSTLRLLTDMELVPSGNNRGRTYTFQLNSKALKHT